MRANRSQDWADNIAVFEDLQVCTLVPRFLCREPQQEEKAHVEQEQQAKSEKMQKR